MLVNNNKKQLSHQMPETRLTTTTGKCVVYRKKGIALSDCKKMIHQSTTTLVGTGNHSTGLVAYSETHPFPIALTASTFTFSRTDLVYHRDHTVRTTVIFSKRSTEL